MNPPSIARALYKTLKKPLSFAARTLMGTIIAVETTDPILALTFDDGPHPEYTLRLLDVLEKYGARATFFCVGQYAARHPDIIRQAVEAGHVVGNHTWDHAAFPLLTHTERCEQIRQCAEALGPYGSRLFRPPYGEQNLASRLDLLQLGYQVICWTGGAPDWCLTNPDQIYEQVLPMIRPGRIFDFHDRIAAAISSAYFDRTPTIEVVERLLKTLSSSYKFVTVPELSRYGQLVRANWYQEEADATWLNQLIGEDNESCRQYPVALGDRVKAPLSM